MLNLSSYETRVFFYVMSVTYTFHKHEAPLNISKAAAECGLHRQHFHRAFQSLLNRQILNARTNERGRLLVCVNVDGWCAEPQPKQAVLDFTNGPPDDEAIDAFEKKTGRSIS
ncbi:MAG: replication protein [Deltaproteobacteria bacterium]|nr:replication protein [Deltaproteobacteria bacterium]